MHQDILWQNLNLYKLEHYILEQYYIVFIDEKEREKREGIGVFMYGCACVRVYVGAYVRTCTRARARACVYVC